MMTGLEITPYERRHHDAVLNLLFYSRRTHTHLDWYRPAVWLETGGVQAWLAWQGAQLLAVLGMAPMMQRTTWIRLLAVENTADPEATLLALWDVVRPALVAQQIQCLYTLVINNWLASILPRLGFTFDEDVVTLFRNTTLLPTLHAPRLLLREAFVEDVVALLHIDHAAFDLPWQMTLDEMRQAVRQAASTAIAFLDQQPVGYQISTRHHTNGHLARLGVVPTMQGQGIGAALLEQVLARFMRRGIKTMSVNTQESNIASLRLYTRYGFRRNGYDLPVWSVVLDGTV